LFDISSYDDYLFWHNSSYASPKVASITSAPFPGIGIDQSKVILQTWFHIDRRVAISNACVIRYERATGLVEIYLIRSVDLERWPIRCNAGGAGIIG
jgi:hypothetical protein